MRHRLQDRLAKGIAADPPVRSDQAKLVTDLARVLRETAVAAAAARPGGPVEETGGKPQFVLPQMLQPKRLAVRDNPKPLLDWVGAIPGLVSGRMASAPMAGALAICCVAVMGLLWQDKSRMVEPPGQQQATPVVRSDATSPPTGVKAARTVGVDAPAPAWAGQAPINALADAERLIGQGNVSEARQVLSRATVTGDAQARFALAETFDPNVLAAWGIKGVSADPGTARLLYEQTLAAGESRAAKRLEALRVD